jgi:hypothetical protein
LRPPWKRNWKSWTSPFVSRSAKHSIHHRAERTAEHRQWLKDYPSINFSPGHLYQYDPEGAEDLKKYDQRIAEIRARKPFEDFVRVLTEVPGQVPETRRLHRGDRQQPRELVLPGDLTVTAPPGQRVDIAADDPDLPTTGRRLAYAQSLTDGNHPLVARVLVNRVWMHHFGRGIVPTPSDFGRMGTPPTHPELLDWLADDLMRHGWSLKRLHRQIMTSTVYRQSSWPRSRSAGNRSGESLVLAVVGSASGGRGDSGSDPRSQRPA